MIEQIITQEDVSPHLRSRLQKAWVTHAADLKNILENKKQSWNRKTVVTSDYSNVHFTVKDVNEVEELYDKFKFEIKEEDFSKLVRTKLQQAWVKYLSDLEIIINNKILSPNKIATFTSSYNNFFFESNEFDEIEEFYDIFKGEIKREDCSDDILRKKFQKAWVKYLSDLKWILGNKIQVWGNKMFFTSRYNLVDFTANELDEVNKIFLKMSNQSQE